MENVDFLSLFQGFGTMVAGGWILAIARVFDFPWCPACLSGLERCSGTNGNDSYGFRNGCNQLWYTDHAGRWSGKSFLDPMLSDTDQLMNTMQIDFLQPVYTLTFSNGLIACFVFMGIGTLLDVGFYFKNRLPVFSLHFVPNWELF